METLLYAYWNDQVSYPTVSKSTLQKYANKGLIEVNHINRHGNTVYWLTQKGLDLLYERGLL